MIAFARSLRLSVVAEGVETEAQPGFLRGALCEQAQRYFISRPLGVAAFEAWRAENYEVQILRMTPTRSGEPG